MLTCMCFAEGPQSAPRMQQPWWLVPAWLALLACHSELNAQSASYVGAKTCGSCHPAQLAGQSETAHARALSPASQHALAAKFFPDGELIRPPRFHFQFRRRGAELRVHVSDG